MDFVVQNKAVFAASGGRPFDAAQPTILMLHGAACDHCVWSLLARAFAWNGYNVIAPDLPGHGRSDGPALETVEELADWSCDLLEAARVSDVAVVGHSLGALIALEAATRLGDRTSALVLIGAAERVPVNEGLITAARTDIGAALDMMNIWGFGRKAQTAGGEVPGIRQTKTGLRLMERAAPGILASDLVATNAYENGAEAALTITAPARVIIGATDMMTPRKMGHALAAHLPNGHAVEVPDCGHMIMAEAPEACLRAVRPLPGQTR